MTNNLLSEDYRVFGFLNDTENRDDALKKFYPQRYYGGEFFNKVNLVHIIDFGLSKRYKCPKSGQYLDFKTNYNLIGTIRYCSLNAHQGHTQSRRTR